LAVDETDPLDGIDLDEVAATLRAAGAQFAYLHGSVASGTARPDSDVDVAAHFGGAAPASWTVRLPGAGGSSGGQPL
jgi:predicted nucleotidyltransferase